MDANPSTPQWNNSNIPTAGDMFERFRSESWSLALLILATVLTLLTVCLYIETVILVLLKVNIGMRRLLILLLYGLFPITSLTSLLSLFSPSASVVSTLFAEIYLAICLYIFVKLIVNLFGGIDSTMGALSDQSTSLRQPPCCCCCFCLPVVTINKQGFIFLRLGIFQYIIVIPFAVAIPGFYWLLGPIEAGGVASNLDLPSTIAKVLSTLTAIYSISVLFKTSQALLSRFYVLPQFTLLRIVVVLVNAQGAALTMIIRFGEIQCLVPLTCDRYLVLTIILNLLLILEMFPLMVVCRIVIGRWIRSGTQNQHYEDSRNRNGSDDRNMAANKNNNDRGLEVKSISQVALTVFSSEH
ncbi:organic solute transporter subunit alpha-like [Asterias amurensis]|uniref:organic solute transporter subunit alpha-like n=1 Tax=Asterias amurensis TaxID=7602 RepID=UPI003AB190FA